MTPISNETSNRFKIKKIRPFPCCRTKSMDGIFCRYTFNYAFCTCRSVNIFKKLSNDADLERFCKKTQNAVISYYLDILK